ncbi:MAG: nSTAND1 domain-containing NTPase [Candidatus Cyclobacteriaceae bacterium M2_1C_046]
MLNYDIVPGESHPLKEKSSYKEGELLDNPFPGLRPFYIEESHLFFGREKEVDEILQKLAENRFVTVIGYSGSGKSSLVHCGVVPVLYGGFIKNVGPNWNVVDTRPGIDPYLNLAIAILKSQGDYEKLSEKDKQINQTVIHSLLKSGPGGFIDAIKGYHEKTGENILLLVDQFEELFRFENTEDSSFTHQDAVAYVQMILQACQQKDIPVSVALTLRSDYIGKCADFQGLTDLINESNYLVPQMSRKQKRMAIEAPVAVGGGQISARLVNQLLNDVEDHQDQLPILQHIMMRTWDYWKANKEEGEVIDIRHYVAVGGISEALSQHADEAFEQLEPRQKEIAEILFKTLTVKTSDNQGIRNAAKISVIAEISAASEEEVIKVVEEFRKPGRSFLMPPPIKPLSGSSRIEISHESLMRIWTRLKVWVDEEFESAQMYKRLSEAAAMYQIGKTGLWRPPDLQLALNWQKKQRPTRAWAQRYDEAFERAIVFLDTSRITYEAEQKNQEMIQRRLLRRTRVVAVVLGAAAVVSILFFVFAITQQFEAVREAQRAEQKAQEAEINLLAAQEAEMLAEERRVQAEMFSDELMTTLSKLEDSTAQLRLQRAQLFQALNDVEEARDFAEEKAQEATYNSQIARQEATRAQTQFERATKLLKLSVAQTMAIKSQLIEDDPDLRAIVAKQAYDFHETNTGRINDPYIYNALHDAIDQLQDGNYNTIDITKDPIRSAVFGPDNIYATSSNGKLYKIPIDEPANATVLINNNFPNKRVIISSDNKYIANASDSSFIQLVTINSGSNKRIMGHQKTIIDMAFVPNSNNFYSLDKNGVLRINNAATGESSFFKQFQYPAKSIAVSPDGKLLAVGSEDSKVYLLNTESRKDELILEKGKNNPAHSLTFHPTKNLLAVGFEKGMVDIITLDDGKIKELLGHRGRVNKLEFSPDGNYLATGSFDRKIYLWVMDELNELPTVLDDHNGYIWDLDFSEDGNFIVASVGTGNLKLWPVNPGLMARNACDMIFRNMTQDEWRAYAGTEIEYQKTCKELPDIF